MGKTNTTIRHAGYEPWLRILLIITIGIGFILIFRQTIEFNTTYFREVLISILRTAILWYGSEWIVNGIVTCFNIMKHPAKNLAMMAASLLVFTLAVEGLEVFALVHWVQVPLTNSEKISYYVVGVLVTFLVTSIYAGVFFFLQWKQHLLRAAHLEKANAVAQFQSLKNQVNPHFLFNNLNTLITLVEENSTAANFISRLSGFLRYILQSDQKETVTLLEELEFARDYAFLEQSRFSGKLNIQWDIPSTFYDSLIPPLSLQMLIENAIKHNIIATDHPLHITVTITANKYLTVSNNLQKKSSVPSTQIGLKNITDRYHYLTGQEIIIREEEKEFTVSLPLINTKK